MKKIENLKKYIEKNDGILLISDLKELNINKRYVQLLCEEGYIERIEKGIYVKKGKTVNDFFLIQQRYKSGVFSHNTALYFYNLTDRTPLKYDLTFKSNIRINNENVKSHYIKNDKFDIGKTKMKLNDGTSIIIYDIERTIIDILRDRNKIDIQIFNTAIKEYMKLKNKNLAKLGKYSKIFNVEDVLKNYMEVLYMFQYIPMGNKRNLLKQIFLQQ